MLIAANSIESDQFIISEVEHSKGEHYPTVTFARELQGCFNYLYLKAKHINLFPH